MIAALLVLFYSAYALFNLPILAIGIMFALVRLVLTLITSSKLGCLAISAAVWVYTYRHFVGGA
jgi:hypothetical protein